MSVNFLTRVICKALTRYRVNLASL